MLNKNLDLDITDFVTVDFTAVADVVDALGGIDIDVQEDEIVHLNNYQVEGSQVTGKGDRSGRICRTSDLKRTSGTVLLPYPLHGRKRF